MTVANISKGVDVHPENPQLNFQEETGAVGCTNIPPRDRKVEPPESAGSFCVLFSCKVQPLYGIQHLLADDREDKSSPLQGPTGNIAVPVFERGSG